MCVRRIAYLYPPSLPSPFQPLSFFPDINEPAIFDPNFIQLDVAERAVAGTWAADVYDIVPPVDPEGSRNFRYSVLAGDHNNVFGIGSSFATGSLGTGNTNVLVRRMPGPLLSYRVYNLTVGATDDGVPPNTGMLFLYLTVQNTRIESPAANFTCYHDNPCIVRTSAPCAVAYSVF